MAKFFFRKFDEVFFFTLLAIEADSSIASLDT
jgi:hypothetical protein